MKKINKLIKENGHININSIPSSTDLQWTIYSENI